MGDPEDEGHTGERLDERNLTREWVDRYPNAAFVWSTEQFAAIDPARTDHLLGLFKRSHMEYEHDRRTDAGGEPSLAEMTGKAIRILSRNPNGFYLLVEAGRVDHAHHDVNAYRTLLTDGLAVADAVATAAGMTSEHDTLIVVTADHGHMLTIAGYPARGNPILGLSRNAAGELHLALDGKPYTTLGYANGATGLVDEPRADPVNTALQALLDRYEPRTPADYENALKEIVQELALLGLWRAKFYEHAAFYGGTALRIFHGLPRFSEDMDFSLLAPDEEFDLDRYLEAIRCELASFGFSFRVERRSKRVSTAIESAFIKGGTRVNLAHVGMRTTCWNDFPGCSRYASDWMWILTRRRSPATTC